MSLDIASLYLLHRTELIQHLLRIVKCPDTADDLVQECYAILTRSSGTQIIEQPRAYLYRTATNLAIDHLRHRKVTGEIADEAELNALVVEPTPERIAVANERLERFRSLLLSLPTTTREVFYLVKFDGLSYREAARQLGLTERQVERHMFKAMLQCRKAMTP